VRLLKAIGLITAAVTLSVAVATPASAAADLAHISPWDNSACSTNIRAGSPTTIYFQYYSAPHDATFNVNLGTADYRFSSTGSCNKYQWIHFVLNMSTVHTYLGSSPHFEFFLWLNGATTHYVDMTISFTGGQADGDFQSYAVKAGAAKTASKIMSSSVAAAYNSDPFMYYNNSNDTWVG
jgi:hypothetical protein